MSREIEVTVTDLARGGSGVARDSTGRVVFVPYTAPGDRVLVRIVEENKRYAEGELLRIIEPAPNRQTPPCPVFGQCGGCQWQHLPYELQWKTKSRGVLQALKRVGVELLSPLEELPAEQIWEYRNRVQLRGDGSKLGFLKRGSNELVSIERCWIARSEINQNLGNVRQQGLELNRPYKVEVEVSLAGDVKYTWNSRHAAGGFRQVHDEQNEKLKNWIAREISPSPILYDLFGGWGNLSIPLVDKMAEIHCVDLSTPQTHPVEIPTHLHFHKSPVFEWLQTRVADQSRRASKGKKQQAVAILDPPREGLGAHFQGIADALSALGVQELIAVGCDPDAWARDISHWVKGGWKLEKAMVMDLFPQTPHIESVGVLRNSGH